MFSKSLIAFIILAWTSSVNAHAVIAPALGVNRTPTADDVQNPSSSSPCGNIDIAQNLDNSTAAGESAQGVFFVDVTSFDGGPQNITAVQVDKTGTGNKFDTNATIDAGSDSENSTQRFLATLAAGTVCTGGEGQDRCLVSFTTADGSGNCVVVSQPPGGVGAPASSSATDSATVSATDTGTASGTDTATASSATDTATECTMDTVTGSATEVATLSATDATSASATDTATASATDSASVTDSASDSTTTSSQPTATFGFNKKRLPKTRKRTSTRKPTSTSASASAPASASATSAASASASGFATTQATPTIVSQKKRFRFSRN